jgi:hypothetical protein
MRFARLVWVLAVAATIARGATLDEGFADPPHEVRPVVWWWFSTFQEASDACITRDLEAMKRAGIAGFHIYGGSADPAPAWRAKVRWSLHEASRLGLDAVVCIGSAGCESQHTRPEFAQKELVFTEARVKGPGRVDAVLPKKGASKTPKNADGSPKFYWDLAVYAVPATNAPVPLAAVRDVSASLDPATGRLTWDAPEGAWRLLRVGYAPNIFGWGGCYIDHMSREAFDEHWRITLDPLLTELKPDERAALKGVMCDSWEAGTVSWTPSFPEAFAKRRGYDVRPWLPALAGVVLEGAPKTARFQRDFQETISELIAENHYAYQREVAHRHGLLSIAEAAGPHQHQADVLRLSGRCDVSMGEFWMPSAHRPSPPQRFMVRDAATAAHVYGIREVLAESFTTIDTYWIESPATMKPAADRAFCDGLNRVCYHGMMLSPSLTAKPGRIRNVGTHYNPQTTWWNQSAAFNLYLGRCAWMLQQGVFVADALLYRGDGLDVFAGLKTPSDALGEGFDYDFCPTEVLLSARVENGWIVLPSGVRYRVLILSDKNPKSARMSPGKLGPEKPLPPVNHPLTLAAMQKLSELVKAGATVAGARPVGPSSMDDASAAFHALADELWGPRGGPASSAVRSVGRGRVIPSRAAVREQLLREGVAPDFACQGVSTNGAVDWIHRRTDEADIYFVASRGADPERVSCAFRATGRPPELWDAVTGETTPAAFSVEGGVTRLTLDLPPGGSRFVVFRNRNGKTPPGSHENGAEVGQPIAGPWQVSFDPAWGGPEKTVFETLADWALRPEEGIRHYAGTAVYRCTFDVDAKHLSEGRRGFIDLGDVKVVADISLNGRTLGTLWTPPWRAEATAALRAGTNAVEVRVTNLWPNRLIGDAGLPKAQRFTETNLNPYKPDSPLLPSGLLGPVRLLWAD